MKTFLLFPLLFLPLLALGQTEPEPLYINGVRLDSVPARYAVVRMFEVVPGRYKLLFNHGQVAELGALRTRYKIGADQADILKRKVRPFTVSNRVEALEVLYENGWELLHYNQLASDDEAARVHRRYEFILQKMSR